MHTTDWNKKPLKVLKTGIRAKNFNFPGKVYRILNKAVERWGSPSWEAFPLEA